MRWPWSCVVVLLLCSADIKSQQQGTPTFRAGVDLVTVDVSVSDHPALAAAPPAQVAVAAPAAVSVADRLRESLRKGVPDPGVPMDVRASLKRAPSSGLIQITIGLAIPASVQGPVQGSFLIVSEVDGLGRGAELPELETGPEGRTARFSVSVPAGMYSLRVALADADGHVGTTQQTVAARLHPLGDYYASDVQLWSLQSGVWRPLVSNEVPAGLPEIRASVELYAGTGTVAPSGLTFALVRQGESQPIVEQAVSPAVEGGALSASAELPIATLEAGTYDVRVTATVGQTPVGAVSATLRKGNTAGAAER